METFKLQLRKVINENFLEDAVPGIDGKLADYAEKVENLLDELSDKLGKLADEGEELQKTDLLLHAAVGQRNKILIDTVGTLRKIRENTKNATVELRRKL